MDRQPTLTLPRAGDESTPLGHAEGPYRSFLDRSIAPDGTPLGTAYGPGRIIENLLVKSADIVRGKKAYTELDASLMGELASEDNPRPDITDEMRYEAFERIQATQRAELIEWFDYLDRHSIYDDGFKLYVWKSVTTTSNEDGGRNLKPLRTTGTIACFPKLNPEALAYVYDVYRNRSSNSPRLDKIRLSKLKNAPFDKLYGAALRLSEPHRPNETDRERNLRLNPALVSIDGRWETFDFNPNRAPAPNAINPDLDARVSHHHRVQMPQDISRSLSLSVHDHHTGWDIAVRELSEAYLRGGDRFLVYYAEPRGQDGADGIPRVAIRVHEGVVADVMINNELGLSSNLLSDNPQIVQSGLQLVNNVIDRLNHLPGGREFIPQLASLQRLMTIRERIHPPNQVANHPAGLEDDDLRFLYELGEDIPRLDDGTNQLVASVRQAHVDNAWDVDRPELVRLYQEFIQGQVGSSLDAYESILAEIYDKRHNRPGRSRRFGRAVVRTIAHIDNRHGLSLLDAFTRQQEEWIEHGVYDYLVNQLPRGARYSLVSTPNNLRVDGSDIGYLVRNFNPRQHYIDIEPFTSTHIQNAYTVSHWSGTTGDGPVRFSLIADHFDTELSYKTREQQVALLERRSREQPRLHIRVPSVMTALSYWRTLRERGIGLNNGAYDLTYINHFDLPVRSFGDSTLVPASFIDNNGMAVVRASERMNPYSLRPVRIEIS